MKRQDKARGLREYIFFLAMGLVFFYFVGFDVFVTTRNMIDRREFRIPRNEITYETGSLLRPDTNDDGSYWLTTYNGSTVQISCGPFPGIRNCLPSNIVSGRKNFQELRVGFYRKQNGGASGRNVIAFFSINEQIILDAEKQEALWRPYTINYNNAHDQNYAVRVNLLFYLYFIPAAIFTIVWLLFMGWSAFGFGRLVVMRVRQARFRS